MPSSHPSAPDPDRPPEGGARPEDGDDAVGSPTALGLARMTPYAGFPPGGEDLYRHIARLVDLGPGQEFLVVPCGRGGGSQFLARLSGASGTGADPAPDLVEIATAEAREASLSARLHYEQGPLDALPYKDDVFDVAVGDIGVAAASDPGGAVAELARVTKPRGVVVLIQPIWTRAIEEERGRVLVEHMGVRPFLLVEWKQMLRDAGIVGLHVEDWSEALGIFRQPVTLRRMSQFVSLKDRIAILYRAWQRWGWNGVQQAIAREKQIRQLVAEERLLGISLIKGIKWHEPLNQDG